MAVGRKTGGRQIGTPNRKTVQVQRLLEQLGCDPITGMATIAMDEAAPVKVRAAMFKELAQYVAPKRKAVELSGEADSEPAKLEICWARRD